ncbi:MAG: M42 family metallopeptidase [Candidatus Coatesbacteria bacterium]|nr:M42 family metallopeptidase [Candidatus Coatesbacteria bacterium]
MDATARLLKRLVETDGISGFEHEVGAIIREELKGIGEIRTDQLGSIICELKGSSASPRVMIVGHTDEIGFIVQEVTEEGYIKFLPIGGWKPQNLAGRKVRISTRKGPVVGVIGFEDPWDADEKDWNKSPDLKKLYIDVGVSAGFDVKKDLDIRPGDPITPASKFEVMSNPKMYVAKAWDDRIGVAVMIEAMKHLAKRKHPNIVFGVGSAQEEVGLRGAKTSGAEVRPDVAFAVDICGAFDTPDWGKGHLEKAGSGVGLMVHGGALFLNPRLRDFMIDLAEKKKIKHFVGTIPRGGTDAGRIQIGGTGVLAMYIGIATRYGHTHNSIIHRGDFDAAVKLMVEACLALDQKTLEQLKAF